MASLPCGRALDSEDTRRLLRERLWSAFGETTPAEAPRTSRRRAHIGRLARGLALGAGLLALSLVALLELRRLRGAADAPGLGA